MRNDILEIRNYLKVAIRSIRKNKIYSGINIVGLAVSMVCAFRGTKTNTSSNIRCDKVLIIKLFEILVFDHWFYAEIEMR